jgi:SAM-dependent methyltransferase
MADATRSFLDTNRATWNERADIHAEDTTGMYAIERFLAGEDVLYPVEASEIGDITGLKTVHLQCHIGVDTLCLARRGAIVTGLDFSPDALRHARDLSARSRIPADFVEGEVYDAPARVGGGFDLVYTTWGTINWLPDIRRWGATVAALLRPGGRLYFADGHPSLAVLDEAGGKPVPTFNWRTPNSMPLEFTPAQTYTGDPRPLVNARNFEWIHPVSDILMALIDNGLTVDRIAEHEVLPWAMFPLMVKGPDRLFRLPPGLPRLPLSLSIKATKR